VVDAQRVEALASPWIGTALNEIPGVYQAQLRGVVDVPSIRMPQSFKNHYLYLQDGVPLQSTVMFNSKALLYSQATTSPGGIEVLKGPGTALYGSDAMSAVIDVHSMAPPRDPALEARVGAGSYGARSIRLRGGGGLTPTQRANVAVAYDGDDGWRDHSAWSRLQGIARHHGEVAGAIIDTSLMATSFRSEMTGRLSPTVFKNDPTDDGLAAAVPLADATDDATHIQLSSAIRMPVGTAWIELTPYLRSLENTYLEVFNPATTPRDREDTATIGTLARVRLQPWAGGELILGTDVDWTRLDFTVVQDRPTVVVGGFNSHQGPHYDFIVDHLTVAPYAQHTQRLGERWIVDLGLRFDWARYDYDEQLGPTTDPQDLVWRPPDRVDTFSQLSPKVGGTYLLTPEQALFARYAHGFRLPAADALYVLGNGQQAFELDPEQVDAFEVGWKGRASAWSWEVDAYWSIATDGIVEDVVTPGGTISTNGGERWYRGVELGGTWAVCSVVDLGASYAHTWHRIIQYRDAGSSPEDGNVPSKAPADLAHVRVGVMPFERVRLEAGLRWLGRWWMDDANTQRTDNEWLVDLRAWYWIDTHWSLDASVINLFDEAYAATAERLSFGDRYRPGQPLTVCAGVTWAY
jgi:outer membrane receptor protein involved in Fe transport